MTRAGRHEGPAPTERPDRPGQPARPAPWARRDLLTRLGALAGGAAVLGLAGCTSGPVRAPMTATPGSPASAPTGTAAGPSGAPSPSGTAQTQPPRQASVKVLGNVAEKLQVPWGLVFLPDGDALVGERDTARVWRIAAAGGKHLVGTVPGVSSNGASGGEAGLLGLALSPHFAVDDLVFGYLSSAHDNRVVRMTYRHGRLGTPHPILTGIPRALHHNGGRLTFGPDGMLYASTGDALDPQAAQRKGSLAGKILRITPKGAPAAGNPFPGSPVYSYGHRNVEGLAWDADGRLWATEFGDHTWDELNLIRPGHDYGWPLREGSSGEKRPDFTDPVVEWHTSEAGPSGIAVTHSVAWIGALTGTRLWRVPLREDTAGTPQAFEVGEYGRLRTVVVAPDGSLWVTTSNRDGRGTPRPGDDRVLRMAVT